MTRGAKLMKPAPRSGSSVITRPMRRPASPSSSVSPTLSASASSSEASTQASPGAGTSRVGWPGVPAAVLTCRLPRSG